MGDNSLKQNTDFLKNTFGKSIVPAMLAMLSANINVFVDGVLVSNKLGSDALAAINLSLPIYLFLCIIGSFFASGTAINAARAIGDNDPEKAQMYYRTCAVSLVGVSLLVTVLGLALNRPIVAFLCSDQNIRHYVSEYVVITLIGALPKIFLYLPFWFLRLDGKNAAVAVIMAVMSVSNIGLDILFVYQFGWGVFGAGFASVIATVIAAVIGFVELHKKNCFFKFKWFFFKDLTEWKLISTDGIPSALNNLLSTVRILIINYVLLHYFGGKEVAIFTAVNGIAGFAECITLGVPQAASPMLGVFSGEQDNGSCKLLIRLEVLVGVILCVAFGTCCVSFSDYISAMYGLDVSLRIPLIWLGLSTVPAVFCTVISGYYNMVGKNFWSNGIIFVRLIAMTYIGLLGVVSFNTSTYVFLFFAEVATIVVWYVATWIYHLRHKKLTRFLLMNTELEESGNVLNFSVSSDPTEICSASERISGFCESNGMDAKTTMRVELAMEEIMTLISKVNQSENGKTLNFDLRAYYFDGITGIRIRYDGIEFNPFKGGADDDEMYMGIMMLQKMVRSLYQRTFGVNTLQVTLRKVKI